MRPGSAEYRRVWRARRAAERFALGLAEADLDWTGIHVLRGMLAAIAYEKMLDRSRITGTKLRAEQPDARRAYNREKMKAYRAADPEKFRARGRDHYRNNPAVQDRVKAQARAWVKANPLAKQIDRLNYARRAASAPGKHVEAKVA